ncbi:MAG TPA: DUF1801 domain-containing protein [Phycisphaerae bacterium]|nr:DUF1801 domain-containing protein [Phycisphaerae bacterium]
MANQWLDNDEVRRYLKDCPPALRDVAWELRDIVQKTAPQLQETISFDALCYSKPGQPYGVIGGNVCMICPRGDCVHLAFIHGAGLPDPEHLLQGKGKAKRSVPLQSLSDIKPAAFAELIRAAVAYDPTANEDE